MLYRRFTVQPISEDTLGDFLDAYKPTFDFPHIEEIFKRTLELVFSHNDVNFTNVIHACFDLQDERYCGILNIGTTTEIDNIASIHVEFVFIEPEYRKLIFDGIDCTLLEFLLLDYTIGQVGLPIKSNIGIGTVALTPINEKVRKRYEQLGFESIKDSGSNKFEDWMVFNI